MLIDACAPFATSATAPSPQEVMNAARLRAGKTMGITYHVATSLDIGAACARSAESLRLHNDAMAQLARDHADCVRYCVAVDPAQPASAVREIARHAAEGAIGVALHSGGVVDDAQADQICRSAASHGLPVIYNRRASPFDVGLLCQLASRHDDVAFLLAYHGADIGWPRVVQAVRDASNVYVMLTGAGAVRGLLDDALAALGTRRLLWGTSMSMSVGLAQLRALEVIGLHADDVAALRWENAARLFGDGAFPIVRTIP